jgi:hypothetical protein
VKKSQENVLVRRDEVGPTRSLLPFWRRRLGVLFKDVAESRNQYSLFSNRRNLKAATPIHIKELQWQLTRIIHVTPSFG